jgi:hypothetical protein
MRYEGKQLRAQRRTCTSESAIRFVFNRKRTSGSELRILPAAIPCQGFDDKVEVFTESRVLAQRPDVACPCTAMGSRCGEARAYSNGD